jgi:PHP family Zn ribbon phosphoesterase
VSQEASPGNTDDASLRYFNADLHIHTCLSPCSEWDMSPRKIAQKSIEKGLDIIAVCDHNSAENVQAAKRSGEAQGLTVFPGMEICSKEEVHMLGLFQDVEQAVTLQDYVYAHLAGENRPEVFGYQVVANENDEVLGEISRLLIGATTLSLHDIVAKIRDLGGISIASHVDRPAFGIIHQLGFIPPDLPIDGVEVSFRVPLGDARKKFPAMMRLPCISSSDAHFPEDIGKTKTVFVLAEPTLKEIRLALRGKDGRRILI